MKSWMRMIAMALVLSMLSGIPLAPQVFAEQSSDAQIYDLMTQDLVNPVGLDDPAPSFSWKMRSGTLGQRQTAYQIVVKTGDTVVWDSGKVESDVSVGIVYEGEALRSSTAYTWSVKVWDKAGKVAVSPEATFEMALLEENAFADTHFISFDNKSAYITDYTVDFDFIIDAGAVSPVFGAADTNNLVMWQIRGDTAKLRPHIRTSGSYTVAAEVDISAVLGGTGSAVYGKTYHGRIQVNGANIVAYIGADAQNLQQVWSYTHARQIPLNLLGMRQATSEKGRLDNLTVTQADGTVFYKNEFESVADNDIIGPHASLSGGWLVMNGAAEALYLQSNDEAKRMTAYTVDFDFIIDAGAVSPVFAAVDAKNHVMWQIRGDNAKLRPHICTNGSYKVPAEINISAVLGGTGSAVYGKTYHGRVEVNGASIVAYIGTDAQSLQQVWSYTHTNNLPLNLLGVRQATSEKGRLDNLTVTRADGTVFYKNDFESNDNDILGTHATASNGWLVMNGAATALYLQTTGSNSLPAYRKRIAVKEGLVSAKLYTAGLGVYESYINGQRVGRLQADGSVQYDELKPGSTQRNRRQFYSSFDVTWMLTQGENVLGGVVTDGWWKGIGQLHAGSETAYLAKLILTYADGTQEIINTDTTWKSAKAAALQEGTGIYAGERYDASVSQDWMLPGFDDTSWSNVKVNTEFTGELDAWIGVPVIVREDLERQPQSLTVYQGATGASDTAYGDITVVKKYTDGESILLKAGQTLLVDFGQNFAGWEYLELEGTRKTVVTVEHGEWLNDAGGSKARGCDGPGGSLYEKNNRSATANTVYTLRGGTEAYHPSFSFYGFQYMEITATADITIHKVRGQVVTSVQNDTAQMETSNSDINKLLSNIDWGMYSNYLSVPTDCPQRDERLGWTGDTQVFAQAGAYLTYSKSFLRKYLQDMRDAQLEADGVNTGSYLAITPYIENYGSNCFGCAGWTDAGIILPWYLYMMYGDSQVIRENWDSMRLYMDVYLESTNGNGPTHGAADHLSPEKYDFSMTPMLGVVYYAYDAKLMVDMANAIGETEAAVHYQAVYERQKALFQERYVLPDGTVAKYEQTAFLLALYLDLLPNEESVAAVTEQLVSSIESYGNRMMTGFLGTSIIMHTLSKIGRTDLAYVLLLQEQNPSWLYSVKQGGTTMWERWDVYNADTGILNSGVGSLNHYAYGAVAAWMYQKMAGIGFDSNTPGFKHILLAPECDKSLPYVKASYESAYGLIEAESELAGNTWIYRATIPANTTASVRLPVGDKTLTVNGKALSELTVEADGIRYVGMEKGIASLEAVAGSFTFTVTENAQDSVQVDWTQPQYCKHCKKNVIWTKYAGALSTSGGHYYLAEDYTATATVIPASGNTCLHLNGKTLSSDTTKSYFIPFIVVGGCTLSVMDHADNRGVVTNCARSGDNRKVIFSIVDTGALNLYGGTFTSTESGTNGRSGIIFADKFGKINMYGGVITGGNHGTAFSYAGGGNICLKERATFTMYGGTISGGTAAAANGGNIYLNGNTFTSGGTSYNGGAAFIMHGGMVEGGTAKNGGGIYAEGNASVVIHGGTVRNGNASASGGNLYMGSGTTLTIDENSSESLICGGCANVGGNIMLASATATLNGGEISFGKAVGTGTYDGGGNIRIDTGSKFTMNETAGNTSLIRGGLVPLSNYGGNIDNHGTFTMNGGTVDRGAGSSRGSNLANWGPAVINGGSMGYTLNGANILLVTNKLTVNGGTLYGGYANGEGSRNITIWDNSQLTVTGGTLLANYSGSGGNVYADKGAIIQISGGSFTGSGGSDIYIALTQADNVKRGTTLNISGGKIGSLYVADNNADYDPSITISGSAVIGKLLRGGDTKPTIAFDLTEGAKVTFSQEVGGEQFGTGSPSFVESDNGLNVLTDGETLKWSIPERVAAGESTYATLHEALADTSADYLTLLMDITEDVVLTEDVILDLNGCVLTGNVKIAEGATLYLFDSATADYTAENRGSIRGTVTGNLATTMLTPAAYGHNYRYLTIQEEDGSYSAHRIYLSVKSLVLTPVNTGISFKTVFKSNALVAQYVDGYGVRLADGDHFYEGTVQAGSNEKTVNIGNILNAEDPQAENSQVQIQISAMITLRDGTVVTSAQASASLQDAVAAANGMYAQLTQRQQSALRYMYSLYESVMESWSDRIVGNIR